MTEFLTANNLTETASELASKVFILSSTGVSTKLSHAFHCRVSTRILKKVILIKKNVRGYDNWSWGLFRINLLQLQLRNLKTAFTKLFLVKMSALANLYIDKTFWTFARDVFVFALEGPLNTNTRITRTPWHVPFNWCPYSPRGVPL